DFGPARISKIQIVRHRFWTTAGAGDIARGLAYRDLRADARVEIDVPSVAVSLERQRAIGSAHANNGRIPARSDHGVRANARVVLTMDPRFRGDRRRGQ